MRTSEDGFGLSMQAIDRIEKALGLVVHRMPSMQNELHRKAEACRELAAGSEDGWRKSLWMERARHWKLEAAKV
jgi:hypothetical protein